MSFRARFRLNGGPARRDRFCATGGLALLTAAGHRFSVSSVNYGLAGKNAQDALHGACPIVASSGGRDRFLRTAPQRLERALAVPGIDHDIKVYPPLMRRLRSRSAGTGPDGPVSCPCAAQRLEDAREVPVQSAVGCMRSSGRSHIVSISMG